MATTTQSKRSRASSFRAPVVVTRYSRYFSSRPDCCSRSLFPQPSIPTIPSWNSAGQAQIQNWAGSIGANVAATGFQFIGLAAYLLPLLLFAAAWRRFRPSTGFKVVDANRWDRGAGSCRGRIAFDLANASVVRWKRASRRATGRGRCAGFRQRAE